MCLQYVVRTLSYLLNGGGHFLLKAMHWGYLLPAFEQMEKGKPKDRSCETIEEEVDPMVDIIQHKR